MARKALGRGLDALIPQASVEAAEESDIVRLPVTAVRPNPHQPRRAVESETIAELAESIRQQGLVQPIVVRRVDGEYQLIAGERRLQAARAAGLTEVPAIVREATDVEALEVALVENIQREDLAPLERARAYGVLSERYGLSQSEIGSRVGKDRSTITNTLRLLGLPEEVKRHLEAGRISEGHARALLSARGAHRQIALCRRTIREALSVRALERLVETRSARRRMPGRGQELSGELEAVTRALRDRLRTQVRIGYGKKKGKIEIEFYSPEDLERILSILGVRIE
ncbi:hypothetical protein AMJ39_03085 [candidate division TA06 bacterium DG_24]|uniref:ParB-like N-terminal domain-containing protein n=3 Tax=Bacteria division TA06 TaxID=1156500 RepID=A0A0S8GD31_UNCT6|nr:MAG: hypothetical protein AMJ39_03085 [candidate division TA06 bacterium DG_24]KPK70750.1 MAG: hypothetical protein AMJ82_02300 [candidate division TA06 bacterium SM23_40]